MTTYIRHPLVHVWAFLTVITIVSWWIGHGQGSEYRIDAAVTVGVLLIAAVKTLLVIGYFMEVRFAPRWLKQSTYGLVGAIFALLIAFYYVQF